MRKYLTLGFIGLMIAGLGGFGWIYYQKNALQTAQPSDAAKIAQVKAIKIVALGDSLTEGVGDNAHLQVYTGRIARQVQQQYDVKVTMRNFGRAGDRSDQIQARLTTQPKLQSAMRQANVIVMTVGGNDLQQLLLKNQTAASPVALTNAINAGQSDYQKKLTTLFAAVRHYNADAPIYIFGNYNPIYVHFPQRTDLNQDVTTFNQINQKVARADKASHYVGIFDLTYGQYRTPSARRHLLNQADVAAQASESPDQILKVLTAQPTVLNDWLSPSDNFHPNPTGYDYMTNQLFQQMKRGQAAWLTTH